MIPCSWFLYFAFAERPLVAENIFILIFTKTVFFLPTQRTQRFLMSDHLKSWIILHHKSGFKSYKNKINNDAKKKQDDLTAEGSHRGGGGKGSQMTSTAGDQAGEGEETQGRQTKNKKLIMIQLIFLRRLHFQCSLQRFSSGSHSTSVITQRTLMHALLPTPPVLVPSDDVRWTEVRGQRIHLYRG